jgi:flavin reductase (DIM6/NTAB) family NADH-FMN oxidoreductase RutF
VRIELESLAPPDIYDLMIQTIVPRPIAWVLSDNGDASFNLAPFSFFNGVTSRPPTISISIGRRRDTTKKDTWRNIEERGHFVLHIPGREQAGPVAQSAASLPFGESEVTAGGITLAEEPGWPLPRVKASRVAMLCRRYQIVEIGEAPQGLIIGEILSVYLDDEITRPSGDAVPLISASGMDPLARLGGDDYCGLGPAFTVERPD